MWLPLTLLPSWISYSKQFDKDISLFVFNFFVPGSKKKFTFIFSFSVPVKRKFGGHVLSKCTDDESLLHGLHINRL